MLQELIVVIWFAAFAYQQGSHGFDRTIYYCGLSIYKIYLIKIISCQGFAKDTSKVTYTSQTATPVGTAPMPQYVPLGCKQLQTIFVWTTLVLFEFFAYLTTPVPMSDLLRREAYQDRKKNWGDRSASGPEVEIWVQTTKEVPFWGMVTTLYFKGLFGCSVGYGGFRPISKWLQEIFSRQTPHARLENARSKLNLCSTQSHVHRSSAQVRSRKGARQLDSLLGEGKSDWFLCQDLFSQLDVNGDGQLSPQELAAMQAGKECRSFSDSNGALRKSSEWCLTNPPLRKTWISFGGTYLYFWKGVKPPTSVVCCFWFLPDFSYRKKPVAQGVNVARVWYKTLLSNILIKMQNTLALVLEFPGWSKLHSRSRRCTGLCSTSGTCGACRLLRWEIVCV